MEPNEPFNPYAPPKTVGDDVQAPVGLNGDLATRWQRLGGSMVDGFVSAFGTGPAYLGVSLGEASQHGAKLKNPFFVYMHAGGWGHVAAALTVVITGVQWYLTVKRGQTLGKMVAGTRIVMLDGSRAGFANVLALRTWSVWVAGVLAGVTSAISLLVLADFLAIFRADRRCLHDLIAGTKVIKARTTP
jgi:hypothetical protein